MRVKLVSYNVRCFPWTSPPISDMVQWITRHAEVVALQEVWCRQDTWAAAFAAHGWSFARPGREHHIAGVFGSGLAFAWRRTSWKLTDARFYPFLSAVGFDAFVTKGWFRAEFTDEAGECLRLINTHMQSDYEVCDDIWRPIAEPIRMAQLFQLTETEARLPPCAMAITGDFNTEICWLQEYRYMTRHAGMTFPNTGQVLDHCAVPYSQPWILNAHRVCREAGDWSDHWPVFWDMRLTASPP
jgi:endonuclease/exonuclease/phosphatase family metal-dependent hydrolase